MREYLGPPVGQGAFESFDADDLPVGEECGKRGMWGM